MIKKILILLLLQLLVCIMHAQLSSKEEEKIKELKSIINSTTHDSDAVNAYIDWDNLIYEIDPNLDLILNKKIEKICLKNLERQKLNKIELAFFEEAASTAFNNLGIIYSGHGNYENSLKYYNQSLEICKRLNDTVGASMTYNNIGNVYSDMGNDDEGLKYCIKSLNLDKKMNFLRGISSSYTNIGNIYSRKDNNKKAMEYYLKSLKIDSAENNESGIASCFNNIGSILEYDNKLDIALDYYLKGLAIRRKNGNKQGMAFSLNAIASSYHKQKKFNLAINYANEALNISKSIGNLYETKEALETIYLTYQSTKDYKNTHKNYVDFIAIRDSLSRNANQKAIIRQDFQHEYNKQKAIDQKENEKKLAIVKEQEKQQKLITGFIALGLILVIIFSIVIFKRLQVTRNQKSIIEDQKNEIEETHKEITDSIAYAKRIQNAILPPNRIVKEYLKNSFIFYKPKDVVAGDFYWLEHKDGKTLFAAADCTGHGVPGAMVSVICNNALNRSVREYGLTIPGKILDMAREIVIQEFEKSEEEVKDGMDIALCSIEGTKLQYAGAHNPLWIIREGEIIETKANKQPIGKYDNLEPYTTHSIDLQKGDTLYIFSDGYVDQFGGEKGKKFKAKAFRGLLLSIQDKSMESQKAIIDKAFEKWKGSLDQIDDVCVIGVRV